jgi:alpha-ketoglutarate-dependent 2,4-dichlorophenoxyacetate dioxygenase
MLDITKVNSSFVAEIADLDLSKPLSDGVAHDLRAALDQYGVLVIPGQILDQDQQLAITAIYGPPETSLGTYLADENKKRRLGARLADISNLDENGELLQSNDMRRLVNLSNQLWHTDSSFKTPPGKASLLYAEEVPPVGGATEFADTRAAWSALDEATKSEIESLVAVHDYFHSRALTGLNLESIPSTWRERQPPARQLLVRRNSETGQKSLYLASHIEIFEGLSEAESKSLLDKLIAFTTQPQFVYRHRWRANDLVIWDNRTTMHRGRDYNLKYRRSMRRGTASDIGPTI